MNIVLTLVLILVPCDTLMAKLQRARDFGEAAELLRHEQLDVTQLQFWAKAFRMPFKTQAEFRAHLELLDEARRRMK